MGGEEEGEAEGEEEREREEKGEVGAGKRSVVLSHMEWRVMLPLYE